MENPLLDRESQGRFRIEVAKVVRLLIRAKEQACPGKLPRHICEMWGFNDFQQERRSVTQLLEAARHSLADIDGKYMEFCSSGGFSFSPDWHNEGAVGCVKFCLATFVDPIAGLPETLDRSRSGMVIDWDVMANWDALPALRRALNKLPDLRANQDGPDEDGNLWWRGKCKHLEKKPHRLCQFMWTRTNADVRNVLDSVWGQGEGGEAALKSALTKLNNAMSDLGVDWSYHRRDGKITRK
ncbi:MAG: hypothetical protein AB7K24_18490 [Gemmataceae bacterium]